MFQLFGVGEDKKKHSSSHKEESHFHEAKHTDEYMHDEDEIHVNISDEASHNDDIGQIALDILETENDIVIIAPIAWVDMNYIDIAIARNILTISGERNHAPIYLETIRLLVEECFYGKFSRSVILPENLAFNKIKASTEHNALFIQIPKIKLPSKSIKIGRIWIESETTWTSHE